MPRSKKSSRESSESKSVLHHANKLKVHDTLSIAIIGAILIIIVYVAIVLSFKLNFPL